MRRDTWYEDEFYAPRARGFQEVLNEAFRQAPWWLVSLSVHGILGIVLTLAHFTDYRTDAPVIVDSSIVTEEPEPEDLDKKEAFDEETPLDAEQPSLEDPVLKEADLSDHVEKDDNEDYDGTKGVEEAMSDAPFRSQFWNTSIGMGGGGGGAYGGRFGGNRDLNVGRGGRHTRKASESGLLWLKRHQGPDGMWSCDRFAMNCTQGTCSGAGSTAEYDMGVTGLAMLAFLGSGNTHKVGKYRETVKKGLKAMIERQTPDGCLGPKTADGHWIYNHAIAAMVLAEAYGMSDRSNLLRGPAQKAVDFLLDCQNPYLGWRYGRQTGESDSSVTGWAVLALKSARMSELHVPDEAFQGALAWFDKVTDPAYHKTGYVSKGDAGGRPAESIGKFQNLEAMTAAGLISRIFILGKKARNRPEIMGAANLLKQCPMKWDVKGGTVDMYYWYYGTLAMFQMGEPYWSDWNQHMKDALLPTQCKTGCEKGSWDPVGVWGASGGRVYATAINILTLEIYYRYDRVLSEKKK